MLAERCAMSRLVIILIAVVAFILLAVVAGAFRSNIKDAIKWAFAHTLGRLSKDKRAARKAAKQAAKNKK